MKIIHVMASGAAGGGARHLAGLVPKLLQLGVDVAAVVGDDGPLADWLRDAGVMAWRWPMMTSRFDLQLGRSLARLAHQHHAALHLHGSRAAFVAALAERLGLSARNPRIYHAHGLSTSQESPYSLRWKVRQQAERLACWRTQGIISCSQTDGSSLAQWTQMPAERVAIVPNVASLPCAVSIRQNDSNSLTWGDLQARRQLALPTDVPVVATLSRLVPQKDVHTLADAVFRLAGVHLAVAGDGPQRASLAAHHLARAGRLHLLGALPDAHNLLAAADLVALSSRWEGEPILLIEAMAMGLPWVATATEGARQLAVSGAGLLAPIGDDASLAQRMAQLLAKPALRKAMGSQGRHFSRSRTLVGQAKQVRDVYTRWLGATQ